MKTFSQNLANLTMQIRFEYGCTASILPLNIPQPVNTTQQSNPSDAIILESFRHSVMTRQESEGQRAFDHGNPQQQAYNQSSIHGAQISQGSELISNISQNNILQSNAIAMGIVQQQQQQHQQQVPMIWNEQASFGPIPTTNQPCPNNQKSNPLPAPYGSVASSSGILPMNGQVEQSLPIAPGSASNISLGLDPSNISDGSRTSSIIQPLASKSKVGKSAKSNRNGSKPRNIELHNLNEKTEKNRERNREHARSTRLRKKAYIQKLKDMANGLRAVQTKEIRERRVSMQNIMNIQKVRRSVVQTFLDYHSGNERDPAKWNVLVETSFFMKCPVTPFRSIRASEVDGDFRIVRGVDGMICDAASVAVMIERVGFHNARWMRIKRSDFLETVDDRDIVDQEIGMAQQPESSLSSESSTGSSGSSEIKTSGKRKRSTNNGEDISLTVSTAPKVSSSSESGKTQEKNSHASLEGTPSNRNISSSDEAEKEIVTKDKTESSESCSLLPSKVSRPNTEMGPPILSRTYLNMVNSERISSMYAVNQDDMIILEDVLMCPYVFRTKNAVLCGALADCVVPGMLRAHFAKTNKLVSLELVFDAMGFMQQLDSANGGNVNAEVIPGSLEIALVPCPNEARIITEAFPPYSIVHVNEIWTKMTKYSQTDLEGKPLLTILQGKDSDSIAEELGGSTRMKSGDSNYNLEDVANGRAGCSTSVHYKKNGRPFVDFMCSYPLTNASNQITHLLHVNLELPQTMTLIS